MSEGDRKVEVLEKRTLYQGYSQLYEYRLRHSLYRGGMSAVITRRSDGAGACGFCAAL